MNKRINLYLAWAVVIAAVIVNLYLYRAETVILADPNDNVFQYSLVERTAWIWDNYGCPLSLSCYSNLVDHNVTYWAEGYSLPFYYSHLPQIAIVATHKLIVYPLSGFIRQSLGAGGPVSLYMYYNFSKYLLLSLFPVMVFIALEVAGFPVLPAAFAAFFASHFSTDGLYGIDPPSFLWRGYGLTSQLYAMFFFPLGFAFTFRAFKDWNFRNFLLAVLFLAATTAGHLGIGIIALLAVFPFIFLDFAPKNIFKRAKRLVLIAGSMILILSYWIIPILFYENYHIVSFWDPIWKFNSYGAYEVIRQYIAGDMFDWGRLPLVTGLITFGVFAALLSPEVFVFALSFIIMLLFYFGRTTWGGLIDLIPGMTDFHLHRFIAGVHLVSLFLLPFFFQSLILFSKKLAGMLSAKYEKVREIRTLVPWFSPFLVIAVTGIIGYFIVAQSVKYNYYNDLWINQANSAYRYSQKDFDSLIAYLKTLPPGRVYAGRPGNWGKDFRLGSTQIYMLLSVKGLDMSQFLPETWSMMSENDQDFDERTAADYDLLNIRYIIAPSPPAGAKQTIEFTSKAKLIKEFGPYDLYEVPTSGWFDVVESPMFVSSDKTNFLNIVYLWHRSFSRTWKMNPLISVEKNPDIPQAMVRSFKMTDEVTYNENGTVKNIFTDFPFAFPQATPSGKIRDEKIDKQTYSATVDVPPTCKNCTILFKMSYHPNWQVTLDGAPAKKYAVFPMYVAVQAGPGTHTISVTHKPNSLKVFLMAVELIAFVAALIWRKRLIRLFPG